MKVSLTVNGEAQSGEAEPRTSLLDFLRDTLRLTATHMGCEHGVCGACSVLLDGVPVRSCLLYAVQAEGHAVTTAEGLRNADGTPGMLISAHALLESNKSPSDEEIKEAIGGNLCRCTGYAQIIESIRLAAERLK